MREETIVSNLLSSFQSRFWISVAAPPCRSNPPGCQISLGIKCLAQCSRARPFPRLLLPAAHPAPTHHVHTGLLHHLLHHLLLPAAPTHHVHTVTCTRSRALKVTRTRSRTHSHARTATRTQSRAPIRAHSHAHTVTRTQGHTHLVMSTEGRARARARPRAVGGVSPQKGKPA